MTNEIKFNNNDSNKNTIIITKKKRKKLNIYISNNQSNSIPAYNNINKTEFNLKLYNLILYDKNGEIIFNSSLIDSDVIKNYSLEQLEIWSNIIKKIIIINEKSKINNNTLHFYLLKNDKLKIQILNLENTNIYLLGIFSIDTPSSIIKIFLLHIILSFLNYMGEKSWFIKKDSDSFFNENKSIDIEKINVYSNNSNKESINKNEDIISSYINNNNYLEGNDNNDLLYTRMYNYFLLLPLIKFFILITKNIFIRHDFYNKGVLYKNFYLVDLEKGIVIFSQENIYNLNNGYHPFRNIKLNKLIWNELLYQGNILKKNYIKKYGKILDFIDYQQFYIRLELKSTHPRIIFILRFMPLLNGFLLVHEYEMKNYSIEDYNEDTYQEIDILNGSSISRDETKEDEDDVLLINEPKFIKEREFFFINFLLSTNSNINNCFYIKYSQIKYFSEEILNIINKNINKYALTSIEVNNIENIILNINNDLYNEYLRINNLNKIISTNNNINNINNISNANDTETIINQYKWNYTNSNYRKNLFQIDEKYILLILFKYRKELKNNQLTIDLSKYEEKQLFSDEENNDIYNNKYENNFNFNNINNQIRDENLSQILNNDISEYIDMPYNNVDKSYNNKNNIKNIKRITNEEICENIRISDEDKSRDRINAINDNNKNSISSIFNLDFTSIPKNMGTHTQNNSKSIKKSNTEKKIISKVRTLNLGKNKNIIIKKRNNKNDDIRDDKESTNINFLSIPALEKSYENNIKKMFLGKYYDTISSNNKSYENENNNIDNNG